MPTYLIIEERDGDELVAYHRYDITEPEDISLVPLSPNTALQIARIVDLQTYYRRIDLDPQWLGPCAALGAIPVPEPYRPRDYGEEAPIEHLEPTNHLK